jgi:CHAD domain-containing protein
MEIEAKFAVTDDAVAKRLQTLETIAGMTLTGAGTDRVRDAYLDTRDRRLFAAGFVCRRRRQNDALLITVKQIDDARGAIHKREELEVLLTEERPPSEWPASPARDRVMDLIGDEPLRALFESRQTRVCRHVLKDHSVVAEWSVDNVSVRRGNERLRFVDLEIELAPQGVEDDLTAIAARVQEEWGLAPELKSKFERALAWVNETEKNKRRTASKRSRRRATPAITLDDAMAEAARKTLLLHWTRMLDHEEGVREGSDIEHVHDMRVATRRMRAAHRVFAEYLDAASLRPFAKMLRRTARALGAVRDLDVFYEKTQHYLDTLPGERKSELDGLLAAWQTEHERARSELIGLFDDNAFARFKTGFEKFLRKPGMGAAPIETRDGEPLAHRVRDVLPLILLRSWAAVRAYDESVSAPDVPLTRLHQLRIASKGLRYTLEFFAGVLNPEAASLIRLVQQLQEHLGNLQDAVVTCSILRDFLTWGEWSQEARRPLRRPPALVVAPGVAAYLATRQNEIETTVQTFPQVWSPIVHPDFKRQLLALIAAW